MLNERRDALNRRPEGNGPTAGTTQRPVRGRRAARPGSSGIEARAAEVVELDLNEAAPLRRSRRTAAGERSRGRRPALLPFALPASVARLSPRYRLAVAGLAVVGLLAVAIGGVGVIGNLGSPASAALVLADPAKAAKQADATQPYTGVGVPATASVPAASTGAASRTGTTDKASTIGAGAAGSTTQAPTGTGASTTAGAVATLVAASAGPANDPNAVAVPTPVGYTPQGPTTQAPNSEAPTTQAPNSQAPSTQAPTRSQPASTPPSTSSAPSSTAPSSGGSTVPVDPSTSGGPLKAVGFSSAEITEFDTAEVNRRIADMRSMGAGWIRIDMNWRFVQASGPGSYNWSNHDRAVQAARSHGMNVLLVLDYAPSWASPGNCGLTCPPRSAAEFATFAGAATRHFAPMGVRSWEIWNEPNLPAYWSPNPDPAAYTQTLKAAYSAIHDADSGATVLLGGQGITYTEGNKIGMKDFVAAVYANGGKNYFDAVAVHAHSYPAPPSLNQDWTGWTQMKQVRDLMVAKGDGGKKIWITEYGAPTNGPGGLATQSNPNYSGSPDHVDESYQAALLTEAFATADGYSWAGPIFWYGYRDTGTSGSNENFFGLLTNDGSRKAAYSAFVSAAARTAKTSPLAPAG